MINPTKGFAMAVDTMVKRLLDERDQKLAYIDQVVSKAEDSGRDLLDHESNDIQEAQERVRSLNQQVDRLTQDLELADGAKNRIRTLDPAIIAKDFAYRSAGDLVWDLIHRSNDPDASMRFNKFMKRAAEHMGLDKDNTVPVAGGFNGLVVVPTFGPVLNPAPQGRPLFTAIGGRPAPALNFNRPRLVDPNVATGVGEVALEKSEMPSKAWDILNEPVTMTRIGGYINVSEVLIEMLAGSLDMVVSQMNYRVEQYSEKAIVTELARTTATVAVAADDVVAAIGAASAIVITNTGRPATYIAMGPQGFGALIGMTDAAGRPLFPAIGAVNAIGTGGASGFNGSIMGLQPVVTPAIVDKTLYVGNSFGLEVYERPLPLMQAFEPSVYGRQVAVATYLGFYAPITTESPTTPEREGTVKITWA
jgi:HK97 family phage major capsid protein